MRLLLVLLAVAVTACSSSSDAARYTVPPGCEACVDHSTGPKAGTCCAGEVDGGNFCGVTAHDQFASCVPADAGRD